MTDNTVLAAEQAAGLRKLADMIENNPEVAEFASLKDLYAFHVSSAAEHALMVRAALKGGAKVNKSISDELYNLTLEWGPVGAMVLANRSKVCEKVVIGTREVTEEVPDPEALAAVPTVTVTRTEDVTRWECKPLLSAVDDKAALAGTGAAS